MSETALAIREPEEVRALRIECDTLRRKLSRAEEERDDLYDDLQKAKEQSAAANHALKVLRKVLEPTFNGLRAIFGELDAASIEVGDVTANPKALGVWASWINKLGGKKAAFIQAMLDSGHPMTSEQLRVATHTGRSTVPQVLTELTKLGLINRDGGKVSLKAL